MPIEQDTSPFVYESLDPIKKEIRLLEFLPSPPDDQILASCQLTTVSLVSDTPDFSALSYVWGDASITKTILLNGVRREVTRNLAEALKCLTRRAQFRQDIELDAFRFWEDAVCINQDNADEKGQQVAMMADIYKSAERVISWLGTDPCIPATLKLLDTVSKEAKSAHYNPETLGTLEWLRRRPHLYAKDMPPGEDILIPNSHWNALRDFAHLPYWSRMWIFQEIVLPRPWCLVFICPDDTQIFDYQLRKALKSVQLLAGSIDSRPRPDFVPEDMWTYLRRLDILANATKNVLSLLEARKLLSQVTGGDRAALCILSAFYYLVNATEPRDYYYSLIGVAQLYLKPDYNKPVQDVCLDFVRAYLDATHGSSWALLFLHDASGDMGFSIGLPSWAPRYHIPMEGIERGPDGKARADEKVFRGFVATETEDSGVLPELTDTSLRVLGVHIDTASLLSYQPSQSFLRTGEMSAVLLDFVRRHGPVYRTPCSEIPAATALFATLMRRIDGAYDFLEGLVLLESLAAAGSSVSGAADEEVSRLWQLISQVYRTSRPTTNSLLSSTNISSLKERVALVWSRALSRYKVLNIGRLFETGLGYLGIAPLGTLEGDEICVLKGFQYPVALRPVGNQYVFIGVCFVLGLMSGEARAFVDDGRASPKVFELK